MDDTVAPASDMDKQSLLKPDQVDKCPGNTSSSFLVEQSHLAQNWSRSFSYSSWT